MNIEAMKTASTNLEAVLKPLRAKFPGKPDMDILQSILRSSHEALSPATLRVWVKKNKRFTTADVMQAFGVDKYAVAGSTAALRRTGDIIPDEPEKDANGYTRWVACKGK